MPIGAVLVIDDRIVARAFNQPIGAVDPTAHAEVLVLREAARAVGNYRLTERDRLRDGGAVPDVRRRARARARARGGLRRARAEDRRARLGRVAASTCPA